MITFSLKCWKRRFSSPLEILQYIPKLFIKINFLTQNFFKLSREFSLLFDVKDIQQIASCFVPVFYLIPKEFMFDSMLLFFGQHFCSIWWYLSKLSKVTLCNYFKDFTKSFKWNTSGMMGRRSLHWKAWDRTITLQKNAKCLAMAKFEGQNSRALLSCQNICCYMATFSAIPIYSGTHLLWWKRVHCGWKHKEWNIPTCKTCKNKKWNSMAHNGEDVAWSIAAWLTWYDEWKSAEVGNTKKDSQPLK